MCSAKQAAFAIAVVVVQRGVSTGQTRSSTPTAHVHSAGLWGSAGWRKWSAKKASGRNRRVNVPCRSRVTHEHARSSQSRCSGRCDQIRLHGIFVLGHQRQPLSKRLGHPAAFCGTHAARLGASHEEGGCWRSASPRGGPVSWRAGGRCHVSLLCVSPQNHPCLPLPQPSISTKPDACVKKLLLCLRKRGY